MNTNGSNSNTAGSTVAKVAFGGKPQCLSQAARDELQRDIIVTVPNAQDSDIWSDVTEPTDKTLIWWPKDPTSGVRIGKPRTYDVASAKWVELGAAPVLKLPERRFGTDTAGAAVSQSKEVPIVPAMPSDDFEFALTPTSRIGSTYGAASANMNDFGWQITAMVKDKVTLQIYNAPSGGIGFNWRAEEKN